MADERNERDTILIDVMASLAAAISLLEHIPNAKAASPSDKMFAVMLSDYKKSLERARKHLNMADEMIERVAKALADCALEPFDELSRHKYMGDARVVIEAIVSGGYRIVKVAEKKDAANGSPSAVEQEMSENAEYLRLARAALKDAANGG